MASSRSRRYDIDIRNNVEGSSLKSAINLTQLPLDTLIQILSFLAPGDIISLRKVGWENAPLFKLDVISQCSKALSAASKVRIVWMNALRRVCLHHEAFGPTFPLEKMSLSDLEHATTSPDRLAGRLRRELPGGSIEPLATRILKPHRPIQPSSVAPGQDLGHFHDLALVSGGRFLITSTSTGVVQIWDLGYSPNMLIKPFPLASVLEGDLIMDMLTQSSPDGTVRLLLISRADIRLKIEVFEVKPLSPTPRFETVGNFSIGLANPGFVSLDAYCLTRDQITFQIDGRTCVWDFVSDSWSMWYSGRSCYQMHVADQNIFILSPEDITIWSIPPLRPRFTAEEALVEGQTPLLTLVCPLVNARFPYPSMWYSGDNLSRDRPLHFDVIGQDPEGQNAVVRYVLKPADMIKPDTDFPRSLPVNVGKSVLEGTTFTGCNGFRSGRLGDHDVLLLWRGVTGTVNANLSPWSRERGKPFESKSGTFWTPPTDLTGGSAFDHCPTSGRLCVMSWGEIRVMDYVLPPVS